MRTDIVQVRLKHILNGEQWITPYEQALNKAIDMIKLLPELVEALEQTERDECYDCEYRLNYKELIKH
jgi:hypothetical protein